MTFSPIVRSDKVNAATFNARFQQIEDRINGFSAAQDVLLDWTVLTVETEIVEISAIPQSYDALLLLAKMRNYGAEYGFVKFNADEAANCSSLESENLGVGTTRVDNYFKAPIDSSTGVGFAYWRMLIVNYTATIANIHMASARANSSYTPNRMYTHGLYRNGPITALRMRFTLQAGSAYALYGLKS